MKTFHHVPNSLRSAGRELRTSLAQSVEALSRQQFVRAWSAILYLFPNLHPDGFDEPGSGWSRVLLRFAIEAWRRYESGDLADEEMYCCDATWSGVYDRMSVHLPVEMERRFALAAEQGEPLHA